MDRPSCQQLVPAETSFRRHSRNSSSTDKVKKDRHPRKASSSQARRSSSVVLDAPTQKLYELGLVVPEKLSRTARKPSASEPESLQNLILASCDDLNPEVTFSQHPAFPHLAEAEARSLGLLLPTVTITSLSDHVSCGEEVVRSAADVAYFNDYNHRYSVPARTANDVFGTLFKRSTPRIASFNTTTTTTTTLPQSVLPPKSPLPLFGKGDKSSHPQESINDEIRSQICTRVRAARSRFQTRLARGDFDNKTEIAFFQRPNALCDVERMGLDQVITNEDLYEGRKLPPLDYARAAYIEASHARREGRQSRLAKPLVNFWHTKEHKAFFVTPEVPRYLSRYIRIPRLPTLRLPADLEKEAAATNATTDETDRPVHSQGNSVVEQPKGISRCDTTAGVDMMLRFIKKQRSRRGSESSVADNNSSSDHLSDAESLFAVKSPTHPPVLPDFDFSALNERDNDNALGLARMHSVAKRYNDEDPQKMAGTQDASGDAVSVASPSAKGGDDAAGDDADVAISLTNQESNGQVIITKVPAPTEAQPSQVEECLEGLKPSIETRKRYDVVSSSIGTASPEHDQLISLPTYGDSIAIRRRSTRVLPLNELVTAAKLPAPLELPLGEQTRESGNMPSYNIGTARGAGMNSAPLMPMTRTRPKEPITSKAGDLSEGPAESIVSSSNTAGVPDDDLSPVLGWFHHEELHRANGKTGVTCPGQGLSFSETFGTAAKAATYGQSTAETPPHRMDGPGLNPVGCDTADEPCSTKQDMEQITVQSDMPLPSSEIHPELPDSTSPSDHDETPPVPPPRRRPINYTRSDLSVRRKSACVPPLFSPRIPSAPIPTRADLSTNTKICDDNDDKSSEESYVKPLITEGRKKLPTSLCLSSEPVPADLESDNTADRVVSRTLLTPIEQTSRIVNSLIFDLMDSAHGQTDMHDHHEVEANASGTGFGTSAIERPLTTLQRSPTYRLTPVRSIRPAKSEEFLPKHTQQLPGTIGTQASTTTHFGNSANQGEHPLEGLTTRNRPATAPRALDHGESSNFIFSHRRQNHMEDGSYLTAMTTTLSHRNSLISTAGSGNSVIKEQYLGDGSSPTHSTNDSNYPCHTSDGARPRLWKDIPVFDKYQGTLVEQDARAAAAKEEAARMYREKRERKLAAKAERKELKRLRKLQDEEAKRQQQQWEKQQMRTEAGGWASSSLGLSSLALSSSLSVLAGGKDDDGAITTATATQKERDHIENLSKDSESSPRKQLSLPMLRSKTSIRVLAGIFGSSA